MVLFKRRLPVEPQNSPYVTEVRRCESGSEASDFDLCYAHRQFVASAVRSSGHHFPHFLVNTYSCLVMASSECVEKALEQQKSEAGCSTWFSESAEARMTELGLRLSPTGNVVWRNDCPDHPRNWATARKFYDIVVVATLEFYV